MLDARPTWLVTGASGFLGGNIGAFLAGRAHRVGAVRTPPHPDVLFDAYVSVHLEHPDTLVHYIDQFRPEVVLHAAALTFHDLCEADPVLARAVNVDASVRLAEAAHRAGSTFVLVSTDAVFDGTRGSYTEVDAPSPTSIYGITKVAAEEQVLAVGPALVARTNFFGWSPTGRRSILEFFVTSLSRGEQVRGFTDFSTSSAYAQVLAEALWDLVASHASGIVHLTSPDSMTKYDFGVAVAQEFGLDADLITPEQADIYPPRQGDISLDVRRAEQLLGRPLPSMRAGVRLAYEDEGLRRTLATHAGPQGP